MANILTFSLGEIYGSEPAVNKKKNLIHIPWRGDLKLVNTFQIVLKQSRKEFPLRSGVGVEWGERNSNTGRNQAVRTTEGPRRLQLTKSNMAGVPKLQDLMGSSDLVSTTS